MLAKQPKNSCIFSIYLIGKIKVRLGTCFKERKPQSQLSLKIEQSDYSYQKRQEVGFLHSHTLWYQQDSVSYSWLQTLSGPEDKSLLRNANSLVTPDFPFICSGTPPSPQAASQTCTFSTIPAIEAQGAPCHETLMTVQPLYLTLLEMCYDRPVPQDLNINLPQTTISLKYYGTEFVPLLSKFLASAIMVYFDEESKAKD